LLAPARRWQGWAREFAAGKHGRFCNTVDLVNRLAVASDGYGEIRFAGAGPTDEDAVERRSGVNFRGRLTKDRAAPARMPRGFSRLFV